MGVPLLSKWLLFRHPNAIDYTLSKYRTNYLYLDFNAIIHNCIRPAVGNSDDIELDSFETVTHFIDVILDKTHTDKLLYIAVDGVAPYAKLSHQRARRYKKVYLPDEVGKKVVLKTQDVAKRTKTSSLEEMKNPKLDDMFISENAEEDSSSAETSMFDTNAITPGTPYMHKLHLFIMRLVKYKVSTDPRWKRLTVVYSSYLVPGEGEQKIMEYIRKQRSPHINHTIFSPDGDLLFLCLPLHNRKILVMKGDVKNLNFKSPCDKCGKAGHATKMCGKFETYKFFYVVIEAFRKNLERNFDSFLRREAYSFARLCGDWIFLSFLVGNDFVPTVPSFDVYSGALDKATKLLCHTYMKTRSYIVNDNGTVNLKVLKVWLLMAKEQEEAWYTYKQRDLVAKLATRDRKPELIDLHTHEGRIKYYEQKLGCKSEEEISNICSEYVRGVVWVYNYYTRGVPAWDWFYPNHYAPTFFNLADVKSVDQHFELKKPLTAFEQLLCVIPPASNSVVPKQLHYIYTKYSSFFPTTVEADLFDKLADFTAVVKMPQFNAELIKKEVKSVINELPYDELSRDVAGYNVIYFNKAKIPARVLQSVFNYDPSFILNIEGHEGPVAQDTFSSLLDVKSTFRNSEYINDTVSLRII